MDQRVQALQGMFPLLDFEVVYAIASEVADEGELISTLENVSRFGGVSFHVGTARSILPVLYASILKLSTKGAV
jgi:hypothetical protein